ncbi:T9SS type A sorting domain-containing protein [Chryseobacterium sp.]|uniref:T9SS type A sorting domain-containing protein n=1 Tax=Chryseobacterium sp. TaxID=1871047 RepID=UPI002FC7EA3A
MSLLGFSQGENNHWYFGQNAAVSFASNIPVALNNSQMWDGFEAVGTASDANGKLLFYTDGVAIRDRSHSQMQNGSGLTGVSNSQQLAIVKHPNNSNQYYVFTTGLNSGLSNASSVSYSVVDMSQGNLGSDGFPLGKVLDNMKNIPLVDNLGNQFKTEAITVVPTPSGSFWVLVPNESHLYSFLFSNVIGFNNGNPVISNLNFPGSLSNLNSNHFSVKASPRLGSNYNFSNFICISSWANPSHTNVVYSFNNITGKVTPSYRLEIYSTNSYSPEFNKDGSVLFLGYYKLYAVDLLSSTTTTPVHTELLDLGSTGIFGSIQRNKYNDVHFSIPNSNFLGKINNPDIYGPGITATANFLNLGNNFSGPNLAKYGLPQLIEQPLFEPQPPRCVPEILLNTPELNSNYLHRAINTIVTKDDYEVNPSNQSITLKAGKSIELFPNTHIKEGSDFLARIEDCRNNTKIVEQSKNIYMKLNLDMDVKTDEFIQIHPNPASTFINIDSGNEKITSWELFDISGKSALKGNSTHVNVQGLPKAAYLLKININNKITTKKVIVK